MLISYSNEGSDTPPLCLSISTTIYKGAEMKRLFLALTLIAFIFAMGTPAPARHESHGSSLTSKAGIYVRQAPIMRPVSRPTDFP
jgi:hypothetical protein